MLLSRKTGKLGENSSYGAVKKDVMQICEVNDYLDGEELHACVPSRYSLMFSDFYIIHHLFRNQWRTETWFIYLDPTNLIDSSLRKDREGTDISLPRKRRALGAEINIKNIKGSIQISLIIEDVEMLKAWGWRNERELLA